MIYPSAMPLFAAQLVREKHVDQLSNSRVAICRRLEMLWRVLDTVEELLEVVVPHLNNQHLSHPPKIISPSEPCLFASLLEDLSPSWKTSLDDLLQLQDDRACPAAVSLALESRDRSRVGPECRTGLPLQTPIPAPAPPMGGLTRLYCIQRNAV